MTERAGDRRRQVIRRTLAELVLPALAFAAGVGFATGNWPASLATGLVISSAILVFYWLDQRFLHPHLEKLSLDWLHLGLEMTILLLDHVLNGIPQSETIIRRVPGGLMEVAEEISFVPMRKWVWQWANLQEAQE